MEFGQELFAGGVGLDALGGQGDVVVVFEQSVGAGEDSHPELLGGHLAVGQGPGGLVFEILCAARQKFASQAAGANRVPLVGLMPMWTASSMELSNWWAHWSQERFSSLVMLMVLMTRSASPVEFRSCVMSSWSRC